MAPKLPPAGLRLNASKPESMLGAMILAPVHSDNRRKRRIERAPPRGARLQDPMRGAQRRRAEACRRRLALPGQSGTGGLINPL